MIALAIGGAACVWRDVSAFAEFGVEPDIIVACNDMIASWPDRLDAAVTMHPERLREWLVAREANGFSPPARIFMHATAHEIHPWERVPFLFEPEIRSGSSGLFCAQVALQQLGATRVVCCGMPMDDAPHFTGGAKWDGAQCHRVGWMQARAHLGAVRSMSGWTRDLVGAPTKDWLHGHTDPTSSG